MATAETLREVLCRTDVQGQRRLVIDLRQLTFMDSSGVREIVLAHRRCVEAGGTVKILPVSGAVKRIVDITGLGDVIPIVDAP